MTNLYSDRANFTEEAPKVKLAGIFHALEYIARESEKLGLKFTAHMIGVAADLAVIEQGEVKNSSVSPDQFTHPSKH